MKWWRIFVLAAVCSVTMLPVWAAEAPAVQTDPSVNMERLDTYYLTKGSTYDRITNVLQSLPADATGLTGSYYVRITKKPVSQYFYQVSAYDTASHVQLGSYFVAKDQSCVWRLRPGEDAVLIYGTAETMLKKTDIVVYPKRIPLGSYGIVRVHVPVMIPYDIKLTSLNTNVAAISDAMNIMPVAAGKTDIVVDIRIGNVSRTVTQQIAVVDTADTPERESRRDPSIGIGIGVGWGGGWHHHGGGIGIGIGPWW